MSQSLALVTERAIDEILDRESRIRRQDPTPIECVGCRLRIFRRSRVNRYLHSLASLAAALEAQRVVWRCS
jgi:hypothetical protein